MKLSKLVFLSLLAFSVFACAPPPSQQESTPPEVDPAQVRAAVEQRNAKFEEAVQNQDAAALGALYTSNAALLPPGGEIVRGKAGAEELWGSVLSGMGLKTVDLSTVELEVSGDTAFEIGEATLNLEPEGGEAMTQSLKYIVVWKKEDGTWKLHWDIWNDKPAPKEEGTD